MAEITREEVFQYHESGRPGKIEVVPTKSIDTQRDLCLAYTPGVAATVEEIARNPDSVFDYTSKGNLIAVVTNGTAILGLGNLGALASKPVMEGKAVLFKRFADVDVFDLELDASTPDEIVRAVSAVAPTFGGINLEDIKAPECFAVEDELIRRLDIPVFHDDQHGTAIIAGAALLNALEIAGKDPSEVKIVVSGAGAAAIACAQFFIKMGVSRGKILLVDTKGVVYRGRTQHMNPYKEKLASDTPDRTLEDAMKDADVFLGLSAPNLLSEQMLRSMAKRPAIFACANPDPEVGFEMAREIRPDAIVGTGRSDYPNQINNLLGFPYIFRGALDVRASAINDEMKLAASRALAQLARQEVPQCVHEAYGTASLRFGPDYILPKPLDPRILTWEAPAVARAAVRSGVSRVAMDLSSYPAKLVERRKHCSRRCRFKDSCLPD